MTNSKGVYIVIETSHPQPGYIFLPSFNTVKGCLHGTGYKGGAEIKVSWSIFGNKELYYLCVQ